ncbi:hypothetical protein V6N13_054527 [Hibiscus sabdariffa]
MDMKRTPIVVLNGNNNQVSTAKLVFSGAASVTATAILARSVARKFVPYELRDYVFSKIKKLLLSFTSDITLVIQKFDALNDNLLYKTAQLYFEPTIPPDTKKIRLAMPKKQGKISFSLEHSEHIVDNFNGIQLHAAYIGQSQRNEGEKQDPEVIYLESDRIRGRRGDMWQSLNLDHPSTFQTLAMDSYLKKKTKEHLDMFMRRKEYYKRVGKAWKRGKRFSVARYGSRSTFWRKVRPTANWNQGYNFGRGGQSGNKGGEFSKKQDVENNNVNAEQKEENNSVEIKTRNREKGECSLLNEERKNFVRHVVNEDLWKFKKCLVGKMATVCSIRSIMNRLDVWGLGEIRVKRMGGKLFLLSIEEDDLYKMLEDVHWYYLRKIFEEVLPWSENFKQKERITWLEASRIPFHCWNYETFRRLAQLLGTLEAVGENLNIVKDCEKNNDPRYHR